MCNRTDLILRYEKYVIMTIVLFSLIVHLLYAIKCVGYYHPDEHFQILEFANSKLSFSPSLPSDLPWEYHDQIRSSLQPYMVIILANILSFFKLYSPFNTILILQIFSAIFGLVVNLMLFNEVKKSIPDWRVRLLLLYLLMFYYFFPLMHSRFSSESISGSMFLVGLLMVLKLEEKSSVGNLIFCLGVGGVLGFSFLIRFQIAFLIIGIVFFLIFIDKKSFKHVFSICAGFLFIIAFGLILDRLFYGHWVFTPWEYFKSNIIYGKAASFGVMPVWGYINLFYDYLISPYSLLIICSCLFAVFKFPRSIFVICFIFFFIAHSIVGHKEMRFMFPILPIIIILLCFTLESIKIKHQYNWLFLILIVGFIVMNSSVQLALMQPLNPNVNLYRYVFSSYNNFKSQSTIHLITEAKANPYKLGLLTFNFYKPKNIDITEISKSSEIYSLSQTKYSKILVLKPKNQVLKDTLGLEFKLRFKDNRWRVYELHIEGKN